MKFDGINGPPGEFASKALVRRRESVAALPAGSTCRGWDLTEAFFFSIEEARGYFGAHFDVKWPVETYDNSLVYVPDPSEMK